MYTHKLHAFIDWAFPIDQIKQVYHLQNYPNIFCKATTDRLHSTSYDETAPILVCQNKEVHFSSPPRGFWKTTQLPKYMRKLNVE